VAVVPIPDGADLAARLGRDEETDYDQIVAAAYAYVAALCVVDPFEELHAEAVLAQAQLAVEARGYRQGVTMTDFGPIFARRHSVPLERLMATHGRGAFA
jgi:hypothetical protein